MHVYSVEELSAEKLIEAQRLMENAGRRPEDIIREITQDERAVLLNPEEFARDLQRRSQSIEAQKRRDGVAGR